MATKTSTGQKARFHAGKLATWLIMLLLITWVVVELFPITFMFFNSVKTSAEIMSSPFGLPASRASRTTSKPGLAAIWGCQSAGIS